VPSRSSGIPMNAENSTASAAMGAFVSATPSIATLEERSGSTFCVRCTDGVADCRRERGGGTAGYEEDYAASAHAEAGDTAAV